MSKILYIHGFASCGSGQKVECLREYFTHDRVISPDLAIEPDQALTQLQSIITSSAVSLLIGSSLGGFYADYLSRQHHIPGVLINPSTQPFITLQKYIGENKNWCTGESFSWLDAYHPQLEAMATPTASDNERYLVLLQTADEILDYRLAARRYHEANVMIEEGGNHRFENLIEYLPHIENFWRG